MSTVTLIKGSLDIHFHIYWRTDRLLYEELVGTGK
jgi:hypothetical protein